MSSESFKIAKDKIRQKILTLLRNQKEEDRLKKSLKIFKKLLGSPQFKAAKTILFYASFDGEVDTFDMMRETQQLGKKIALPIIDMKNKHILPVYVNNLQEDLVPGPFGIKQPRLVKNRLVACEEIDLSIVPGIAFDQHNHRLGRGAGYYDRFLIRLSKDIPSIGLAFDFQVVDSLPRQDHDVALTRVIVN